MRTKREFVRHILNYLDDREFIQNWESVEIANRYDYIVNFSDGRIAGIETKGCLDGNNTNIFERPPQAHEFILGASAQTRRLTLDIMFGQASTHD